MLGGVKNGVDAIKFKFDVTINLIYGNYLSYNIGAFY